MKHETTTYMTKQAIATSLKKLMEQKPLSKISVREIIEDCGLNRKTFYYHFQDIYDLVRWVFLEEALYVIKQYDLIINYEDAIRFALNYVEDNKLICNCAYDSIGRDELMRFFKKDFFGVIANIVNQLAEKMRVPQGFKDFLIDFYTEALAALLIEWIRNKDNIDKETVIKYLSITIGGNVDQALARAEAKLQ